MTATAKTALAAALGALALSAGAASASAERFTFSGVEYAPRDQREPMAQAYIARSMAPGASMLDAIVAAQRATARCGRPAADGVVVCKESSMEKKPGEDLSDITWTVRLVPTADGRVADASVTRSKAGF